MRTHLTRALAGTAVVAAAMLGAAGTASAAGATTKAPTTLTATAAKATITPGEKDLITGTLQTGSKPVPGKVVWLERFSGGKLVPVEVDLTGGAGHVFFTVTPSKTTTYELVFKGTAAFSPSRSNLVKIVVAKAPTTLSAMAAKTNTTPGESDLITGTLLSNGDPVAGKVVYLERFSAGKFIPVQVDVTGGLGHVFYTVKPTKTAIFKLVFKGTTVYTASTSNVITITVAKAPTTLSAMAAKTNTTPGESDLITGTLLSNGDPVAGKVVYLERFSAGKFIPVQVDVTGGLGHVFYTVKPTKTAIYVLAFKGTSVYSASTSNVITITVAKAPTTLTATADKTSITAGQSAKITGTLLTGSTAVAGKVVYLERLVKGKFVAVAVDLTGGAGHVFFTVKPAKTAVYELVFKGTSVYSASTSNVITITVS